MTGAITLPKLVTNILVRSQQTRSTRVLLCPSCTNYCRPFRNHKRIEDMYEIQNVFVLQRYIPQLYTKSAVIYSMLKYNAVWLQVRTIQILTPNFLSKRLLQLRCTGSRQIVVPEKTPFYIQSMLITSIWSYAMNRTSNFVKVSFGIFIKDRRGTV